MAVAGRVVREGVIAGLVGAAVVAAWFLIVDFFQGAPLRTPAVLGAVILQGVADPAAAAAAVPLGAVLGYTVVHGLGFVVIGVVASMLVAGAEREPAMLLALLIFFAAFEVFFLALVAFIARPVLVVVDWWQIPIGNLLASGAMLACFARVHGALARTLLGRWVSVILEGGKAGLIGGAVVAVWFLVFDTLAQMPLRTPALLGTALFRGFRDPGLLRVDTAEVPVVLGYTVLHFVAFAAIGVLTAALLMAAEREPRLLLVMFILFWCYELVFLGFVSALDTALVGQLGWWNIAVANLLAAASMLTYFFLGHRALGARLFQRWSEE